MAGPSRGRSHRVRRRDGRAVRRDALAVLTDRPLWGRPITQTAGTGPRRRSAVGQGSRTRRVDDCVVRPHPLVLACAVAVRLVLAAGVAATFAIAAPAARA